MAAARTTLSVTFLRHVMLLQMTSASGRGRNILQRHVIRTYALAGGPMHTKIQARSSSLI
jgi:hypothetical protein